MTSILDRILSGDKQAVTKFYNKYANILSLYLKRRLPQDVAEEILSDVFLEAIDALPTLQEDANLRAWLFKIAHNKTVDYYRKKKIKQVLLSQVPFLEIIASEIHEPEFQLEKNAIRDRIESALYKISKKYRKILRLHYEEQIPVKQIAVIFDLTPKATESLLYRARRSFMLAYGRA